MSLFAVTTSQLEWFTEMIKTMYILFVVQSHLAYDHVCMHRIFCRYFGFQNNQIYLVKSYNFNSHYLQIVAASYLKHKVINTVLE